MPILFFVMIGFGYLQSVNILDPDFGWHIKTGELILERGVPHVDWYSFTMPNFPWIDHEWLTDVLIYEVYSILGYKFSLSIFLILAVFSFLIFIKLDRFNISWAPILFGFLSVLPFLGARPQIITSFFVAVLWLVLLDFLRRDPKGFHGFYLLPLLFLLWVNLHGGFAVGIFILLLISILEILKRTKLFQLIMKLPFFVDQVCSCLSRRNTFRLLLVLVLSFIITSINPYGFEIYVEIFRTIGDNFLRFRIAEWMPLFSTGASPFTIIYSSLFLGLLALSFRRIEFSKAATASIFLLASFVSQRYFLIFAPLSVPVFFDIISDLQNKINPNRLKLLFSGVGRFAIIFFFFALFFSGSFQNIKTVIAGRQQIAYPEKAISFLKTLPLSDNLLNEYRWGGYLIWKLPERRVFIDGRMPSWRQGDNFVFGDYVKIFIVDDGFQSLLDRYNVKFIIISSERKLQDYPRRAFFIDNWLAKLVGYPESKNFYKALIDSGWKIIYEDDIATVLSR